jgi:hypothetical protein
MSKGMRESERGVMINGLMQYDFGTFRLFIPRESHHGNILRNDND